MITLKQLSELAGTRATGPEDMELRGMRHWKYAAEGELTFATTAEELGKAAESKASCVVTELDVPETYPKAAIKVDNLKKTLTVLYNAVFEHMPTEGRVHPSAVIDPSAKVAENVYVGACAVIRAEAELSEGVRIGDGCVVGENVFIGPGSRLHANVAIYDSCRIGKKVKIHASSVIGSDGFGYVPGKEGIMKVPQMGAVVIEDGVEIGANACIDRGTFTDTVIGAGTKIDNLVQVAHNVKIGRNVLIAAQAGMGGSTTVGDNTMMAGQVGIADHVTVPENVKFGAQCGVSGKLHADQTYLGSPVRNVKDWMKLHGLMSFFLMHLKKIKKFVRELPED